MRTFQTQIARIFGFLFTMALCATATFVHDPTALNSNDSVSWSQLGSSGVAIPQNFDAFSIGGSAVFGNLIGGGGTVAQACPAPNCNFAVGPGMNPGDYLIWTEDVNGSGTGPLFLSFSNPVRGAGLYLELTAPASFAANLLVITATGRFSESINSGSSGNPVFLGILDPTADILSLEVGAGSCVPSSPGGCNPSDFAVDTLFLTTAVPEPGTLPFVFLALAILGCLYGSRSLCSRNGIRRAASSAPLLILFVITILPSVHAQTSVPYQPGEAQFEDGTQAVRNLPNPDLGLVAPQLTVSSLPVWYYNLVSPLNNQFYSGYMVGQNPFNRGARTITIPTILVPVIMNFHNTTSGFTATFDPSGTPDAGCTAGQTAMSLVENSPVFQNNDWTMNGIHIGYTQYIDAFQRANFWQYVQNTGDSYHTLLTYTVGDPLTIDVNYTSPTLSAEVRVGVAGPCTNPSGSGSTNGSGYEGFVNISTIDAAAREYIATHAITPDQFPIFILYKLQY